MIVVVCLNPALDITYEVPAVDWAGVNRPVATATRPGGKGTNVARNLRSFGLEVLLTGLSGGLTGRAVETRLTQLAVPAAFTPIAGETRRTVAVVDGRGPVALFNEPGPAVTGAEFARFRSEYRKVLGGAAAVVLSGSLPGGLPDSTYAELIALAAAAGVPAVLDTHGEALRAGIAAGPAIVKPNLEELRALSSPRADGTALAEAPGLAEVTGAARELRAGGAGAVVVSLGPTGLLAVTGEGCWHVAPPTVVRGNATGAGDAVTAALAHGLVLGRPWADRLRHAAALGAAAVGSAVAGEFSDPGYPAALGAVTVSRLEAMLTPDRDLGGAGPETGGAGEPLPPVE